MGEGRQLTGHTVDGFEGPQDTHSADGGQVDVLKVQRVLHHPVEKGEESEDGVGGTGGATGQTQRSLATHTHPYVPMPAWEGK